MGRGTLTSYQRIYGPIKQEVLKRDHHTCRLCGRTDKLLVHHQDNKGWGYFNFSFSYKTPINNNLDNLITLCPSCHLKVHNFHTSTAKIKGTLETILNLRQSGETYQAIADRFGVSRQRIHQILMYNRWEECFHVTSQLSR